MRTSLSSRARARAFTLVELAIVVVVIGILAVVAGVLYSRHRASVRTLEATQLTAAIRTAQEAFKNESGVYAAVSSTTSSFYPASTPGAFVTAWGGDCTNCVAGADGWRKLAVHPASPVMFGYATVSGIGATSLAATPPPPKSTMATAASFATSAATPVLKATDPYYVTVAWGDTDADGKPCIVLSYSTSNQIVVQSEGE